MPELIVRKWDGPYSFMVFREYGVYKVRRGDTGEVQFKDTSAPSVMEQVRNALPNGGRVIIVGRGTVYDMSSVLNIDGLTDFELIGVGYPTLDFSGSPANTSSIWFQSTGITNGLIRGLRIINSKKAAIIGKGTKVTIEDCIIENADLQGINMQGTDIAILNNKIDGVVNEFGIVLGGKVDNATVVNNKVRNCQSQSGIQWGYSGSGVTIADNVIVNCANGISIGGKEAGGYYYTEKCLITDNVIRSPSANGIEVMKKTDADPSHVVRDFKVSNNKIYDAGGYGLRARDIDTIIFEDNLVKSARYGLYTEGTNINLEVLRNRFYSLTLHGISIVHDNVIIRGNRINTTGSNGDGIYLLSGNTFTNVLIEENIFENIGRDAIRNLYSGNLPNVRRNIGFITENSGLATIPNGSSSVVVNHGLAAAPSVVKLTGTHSEVKDCWVTNPTSTQFTINAPAAVSADRDVYWQAEV